MVVVEVSAVKDEKKDDIQPQGEDAHKRAFARLMCDEGHPAESKERDPFETFQFFGQATISVFHLDE